MKPLERWDAYDRNGIRLPHTLVRGEPLPAGMYHLVVSALVQHVDGTFLLMLRDPAKETWPGVYEASASGSALMGETAQQAVRREVAEETGIQRGTYSPLYKDRNDTALFRAFLCVTDWPKEGITLQEGETTAFRWVTAQELLCIAQARPRRAAIHSGVLTYVQSLQTRG